MAELLSLADAAARLKCAPGELEGMVKQGTLRAFRDGDAVCFRRRDIRGLRRIRRLLAGTTALPGAPPPPADPPEALWRRFERGELIQLADADWDEPAPERSAPQDLGESVFSQAIFGEGDLAALVARMDAQQPMEESVRSEIETLAKEISGGQPRLPSEVSSVAGDELPTEPVEVARSVFDPSSAPVPTPPEGGLMPKIMLALVLVGIFGGVLFLQLSESQASAEQAEKVTTGVLARGDVQRLVEASGTLKARRQQAVVARLRGTVAELRVAVGQQVQAGKTVIATLRAPQLDDEIVSARGDLETRTLGRKEAVVAVTNARNMINKERQQIVEQIDRQITQAQDAVSRAQSRTAAAGKQVETIVDELRRLKSLQPGSEPDVRVTKLETEARYARLELQRSRTELTEANAEVKRLKALRDPDHTQHKARLAPGRDNLIKAELAVQRIDKEIAQAKRRLTKASERKSKLIVTAPISGVVEQLEVQRGDPVADGTELALISDRSQLRVEAQVDEGDVTDVQRGFSAAIHFEALRDRRFSGRVTRIATRGTRRQGSGVSTFATQIELDALEDSDRRRLRPGLTAQVEIEIEAARGVLRVPIEAILERKDEAGALREVVIVVEEGERPGSHVAREVLVKTGLRDALFVALAEAGDLEPGAKLVLGPYRVLERLRDGDPIEPSAER